MQKAVRAGQHLLLTAAIVAATAHAAAAANVTTYTTRSGFDAAAGATRAVDFAEDDFGQPLSDPPADVGYEFLGLSGMCFQVGGADLRSYYNIAVYTYPDATIRVDLPSETYAFGTDLVPFYPIAGTFTVTLSSGEVFPFPPSQSGWSFFGVVSDTPIQWATFHYDNTYHVLDNFAITFTAGPGRGCPPPPFIPVQIDIKPGSDPNCFNINGHGVIPVAIMGSETLDVSTVDTYSLALNGLTVRLRGNRGPQCSFQDANGDPYDDLVCQFEDDSESWVGGDGAGTVTGELVDGTLIEGSDSICIVP